MDYVKSILFVLPATAVGGAETKFFNIIKHMAGVRCVLLTQRPVAEYFASLDVATYLFDDFGCFDPMLLSAGKTLRYARAIAGIVRREKIDCVVGIMHTGSFYASAARDIFRFRPRILGTIEGNVTAFFERQGRRPSFAEKMLLWYLLRRPSAVVVPSGGVKDDLVLQFKVRAGKISVIYNGIDVDAVRLMADEPAGPEGTSGGPLIVTACRLNAQKDFGTLLRAFALVREKMASRLVIVGEGEMRDEVLGIARDLGIEAYVTITGFQMNPFRFFRGARVFVLSSFFEGFGNVIVEAMTLGLPVVATDCPSGPAEIIRHGVDGYLVPPGDHVRMAETIITLLNDDELRRKVGGEGIRRAENFRLETMLRDFRKIIDHCF